MTDSTKYLQIEFRNGETWEINARIIAEQRAEYYANKECEKGTEEHQEMLEKEEKHALNNLYVLRDWALGSMNWETIERHAKKIEEPNADRKHAWRKGDVAMNLEEGKNNE